MSAVPAQQLPYFQLSKLMAHLLFDVAMMGLGDLDRIFFISAQKEKQDCIYDNDESSNFCV